VTSQEEDLSASEGTGSVGFGRIKNQESRLKTTEYRTLYSKKLQKTDNEPLTVDLPDGRQAVDR
jgi:hypothetical protein